MNRELTWTKVGVILTAATLIASVFLLFVPYIWITRYGA